MKYEINGQIVETDKPLSEGEIDEIASTLGSNPAAPAAQPAEASGMMAKLEQMAAIEKQPGLPRGAMGLVKQFGRQFKDAATSPIPGSMLRLPLTAIQDTASQTGADVARAVEPTVGKWPARAAGFGTAAALDPTTYMTGGVNVGKAVAPAGRAAVVKAAQEAGIPLTRAEVTGGRMAGSIESALEKTLTGSQPIENFRQMQAAALESTFAKSKQAFGTADAPIVSGNAAKEAFATEKAASAALRRRLYEQVPDNVHVPLTESANVAESIILKQKDYLPTTRNSDVLTLAEDVQNTLKGKQSGSSIEAKGVTTFDAKGEPIYGVKHSAKPEDAGATPPNWPMVKRLRETLTARIKENQGKQVANEYIELKNALDNDINTYVTSATSPLDSMIAKEFRSSYKFANAYNAAFQKMYKNNPLVKQLETASPSDVPQIVFGSGKVEDVFTAKAALGDEGFAVIRKQFFNELVSSKNLDQTVKKYDPSFLRAVFNNAERQELAKLVDFKKITLSSEKMGGTYGSSRTNSAMVTGSAMGAGLATAGYSALTGNIAGAIAGLGTAAAAYGVPKLGAKAYLSKGLSGVNIPVGAPGAGQAAHQLSPKATLEQIRAYLAKETNR